MCNRLVNSATRSASELSCVERRSQNGSVSALILTCFVVDGTRPDLPLVDSPGATLLVVSAGFATANQLASVAIAADDVGLPLKGVIVTNPDSDDRTTGRFPQATPRHARSPQASETRQSGLTMTLDSPRVMDTSVDAGMAQLSEVLTGRVVSLRFARMRWLAVDGSGLVSP